MLTLYLRPSCRRVHLKRVALSKRMVATAHVENWPSQRSLVNLMPQDRVRTLWVNNDSGCNKRNRGVMRYTEVAYKGGGACASASAPAANAAMVGRGMNYEGLWLKALLAHVQAKMFTDDGISKTSPDRSRFGASVGKGRPA